MQLGSELGPNEVKKPTEAICCERAPRSTSSVPITHETKRRVSKPQHRKECAAGLIGTQLGGAAAAAAPASAVFLNFTSLLLDGRGKEAVSEYFWGWKEVM